MTTATAAKNVYNTQLTVQGVKYGVIGAGLGGLVGGALYIFIKLNGFGEFMAVPAFTVVVGSIFGFAQGRTKAAIYHHNFVNGVRRVLRMSAEAMKPGAQRDERLAQAESNDDKVLDKALKQAGFDKGLRSMSFYANPFDGRLFLPSSLKDINGNRYGIQGSSIAATAAGLAAYEGISGFDSMNSTGLNSFTGLPDVNVDGMPMIDGTTMDVSGKTFGETDF